MDGTDPLPHAADVAGSAFADHRPDVGVALDETLNDVPDAHSLLCIELLSQDVVPQRRHADVRFRVRDGVGGVQAGLGGEFVEGRSGEEFGPAGCGAVGDVAMAAVAAGEDDGDEDYKVLKILSKREEKGSSD